MSTGKTKNYQLHSWAATDHFLRTEMNENFTKLDAALNAAVTALNTVLARKAEVVMGTYTPDNAEERFINLGFTPKAVLVVGSTGEMGYINNGTRVIRGGLALPGHALSEGLLEITTNGFKVRNRGISGSLYLNMGEVKYYLAFR